MRHTMCPSGTGFGWSDEVPAKSAFASTFASASRALKRAPAECLGDVLREEEGAEESGNAEPAKEWFKSKPLAFLPAAYGCETENPRRLVGGVDPGESETAAAAAFFASTCASMEDSTRAGSRSRPPEGEARRGTDGASRLRAGADPGGT
jgi:hypothetical protein